MSTIKSDISNNSSQSRYINKNPPDVTHPLAKQFVHICATHRKLLPGSWSVSGEDVNNVTYTGVVPWHLYVRTLIVAPGRKLTTARAPNTIIVEFIGDDDYALAELVFDELRQVASITFHKH